MESSVGEEGRVECEEWLETEGWEHWVYGGGGGGFVGEHWVHIWIHWWMNQNKMLCIFQIIGLYSAPLILILPVSISFKYVNTVYMKK